MAVMVIIGNHKNEIEGRKTAKCSLVTLLVGSRGRNELEGDVNLALDGGRFGVPRIGLGLLSFLVR